MAVTNSFSPLRTQVTPTREEGTTVSVFTPTKVFVPNTPLESAFPTRQEIDALGTDLSRSIGATTEKIIAKLKVSQFDDLGKLLVDVQAQANKLTPASEAPTGIGACVAWFKSKFSDVQKEMTLQLAGAEQVFDGLVAKMNDHIRVHQGWVRELDEIYTENYLRYKELIKLIQQCETQAKRIEERLAVLPTITLDDLDAPMKMQEREDIKALIRQLSMKKDHFLRLKVRLETNGPRIRNQQETSYNVMASLRNMIEHAIPEIKSEFALFIQALDSASSNKVVGSMRDLVDSTMRRSADAAYQSAVDSATELNKPLMSTDLLQHIRTQMLKTVTEVNQIHSGAEEQRKKDAQYIEQSQKQYLEACQQAGAIR